MAKNSFSVSLLLIFFSTVCLKQALTKNFKCQFSDGGKFFDLRGLARATDYRVESVQAGKTVGDLNFNFCGPAKRPTECASQEPSSAYFVSTDNTCYALSINTALLKDGTKWDYSMGKHGPKIIGSNKSNKLKYNLQINLHCAFIGQNRDGDIVNFEKKTNTFEIKMYHFRGCGFYNYNFTIAQYKMKWIVCILGLILGCYINLCGIRFYQFTLALISGISVSFVSMCIVYYLTGQSSNSITIIYLTVVPFNLGLFSQIFFYYNPLLALVVQGFCFGVMANIMCKGFFMGIFEVLPSVGINCFLNFFWMIIGAIFSLQASRPFSMVAMSFIGAFIVVRCVGIFLGNLKSEDDMEFDLHYGEGGGIPVEYYCYFCMTFALTFFGILSQYLLQMLHLSWGQVDKDGNLLHNGTLGSTQTIMQPTDIVLRNNSSSSEDSSPGGSWIDEVNSFDEASRNKSGSDDRNLGEPTEVQSKFDENTETNQNGESNLQDTEFYEQNENRDARVNNTDTNWNESDFYGTSQHQDSTLNL